MSKKNSNLKGQFPTGDELQAFVKNRNRVGLLWRSLFLLSTIVGIIALMALLYNVIIGSFGLVAMQNKVDPASIVLALNEETILASQNTVASEDDKELAKNIIKQANGIGFFGYANYAENSDDLKILAVNGVEATVETASNGDYPLTRPLYIYTSPEVMTQKPNVAAYLNYYLSNVNGLIEEVSYFPASTSELEQGRETWLAANELEVIPEIDFSQFSEADTLAIAGSSTVYPVSRQLAIQFRRAGYPGGGASG